MGWVHVVLRQVVAKMVEVTIVFLTWLTISRSAGKMVIELECMYDAQNKDKRRVCDDADERMTVVGKGLRAQ
jgi:hypothetical protein